MWVVTVFGSVRADGAEAMRVSHHDMQLMTATINSWTPSRLCVESHNVAGTGHRVKAQNPKDQRPANM